MVLYEAEPLLISKFEIAEWMLLDGLDEGGRTRFAFGESRNMPTTVLSAALLTHNIRDIARMAQLISRYVE